MYNEIRVDGGLEDKASACNAGDPGSVPELGRSSGEGNGNPLQYSCLENPIDGGDWEDANSGVAKSQTRLSYSLYFTCGGLVYIYIYIVSPKTYFRVYDPSFSLEIT